MREEKGKEEKEKDIVWVHFKCKIIFIYSKKEIINFTNLDL